MPPTLLIRQTAMTTVEPRSSIALCPSVAVARSLQLECGGVSGGSVIRIWDARKCAAYRHATRNLGSWQYIGKSK
ncbi:hypothetical protein N0V93_006633 [Gnomoniopsis smithogilvyi]|uniref:Uncharacterized protein n=1 Tax=Gnomoniopsis smithogilvyi TaxID=1191159 RepID=A0A9W8YP02_9PEZI|nr:hypothetical protein N0V93_006633 [Gnomoniopsis smithogilvyi]